MNKEIKEQLNDLAIQMEGLVEQASRVCKHAKPSKKTDSLASALDKLQKANDYILAVTTDEPPGDYIVRLNVPGSDEPVRLEAGWSDSAVGFQIKTVPIGLAIVARAIDAAMANREHSGTVGFHWSAFPVELEDRIE